MRVFPVTLTVLSIVCVLLHLAFFSRLKRRFVEEWNRLGNPNFLWPTDIRSGGVLMRYVLGGRFAHLPDRTLVIIGQLLRICQIVFLTRSEERRVGKECRSPWARQRW